MLVLGFALLTAGLAQVQLHLSVTPVPITGQTLGVLLAGGALGATRGGLSQLLYWVLGLTGLPFYADHAGGWESGTGTTFGYFVGFVFAAALIGWMAERRQDRNVATSIAAMSLGSLVIYVCGAGWLAHSLGISVANGETNAIGLGVTPFLLGDLAKLVLAGALLPAAWIVAEGRGR